MKRLLFALAFGMACAAAGNAQEGSSPLKVTTTLNADGTRTDIQKDIDARTSEAKTYDASKKLIQRAVFTLDDQGREVEGTIFDGKDRIVGRTNFTYNAMGRVDEQTEKAPNGAVLRRVVFHYDPNGRVIGADTYDGQGNLIRPASTPASGSHKKSR